MCCFIRGGGVAWDLGFSGSWICRWFCEVMREVRDCACTGEFCIATPRGGIWSAWRQVSGLSLAVSFRESDVREVRDGGGRWGMGSVDAGIYSYFCLIVQLALCNTGRRIAVRLDFLSYHA